MSRAVSDPIGVVAAWHGAVNAGDATRLGTLVADDVELVGPRGPGSGRGLVLEWVEPLRFFCQDENVVVEQRATWATGGGQAGEPRTIATTFVVRDDRVERIARYPDLASALAAAGLDESHEVEPPAA